MSHFWSVLREKFILELSWILARMGGEKQRWEEAIEREGNVLICQK